MLTKWTVRISSRMYLAVVLPPNTELRRMFSLSFGYQTFGTLAVSDWVSDLGKHHNKIRRIELVNFRTNSWEWALNIHYGLWAALIYHSLMSETPTNWPIQRINHQPSQYSPDSLLCLVLRTMSFLLENCGFIEWFYFL